MSEWTPLVPRYRRIDAPEVVMLYSSGVLRVSSSAGQKFRPHTRVEPVLNGEPHVVGFRGVKRANDTFSLNLSSQSQSAFCISALSVLSAISKRAARNKVTLPHRWEGDVLVVDFSGLPDAEARP